MRISDGSSDVCSSDLRTKPSTPQHSTGATTTASQTAQKAQAQQKPAQPAPTNKPPVSKQETVDPAANPPKDRAAAGSSARQVPVGSLQLGRGSCRERGVQYVVISVGAVSFKKK